MDAKHMKIRLAVKELERTSMRAKKEEAVQRKKVKAAIEKKDVELAKIYAEVAIQKKNEAIATLQMSARIGAVSERYGAAIRANKTAGIIGDVITGIDKALRTGNLKKIDEVMASFEGKSQELTEKTQQMDSSIQASSQKNAIPPNEVALLMQEVADEHGLEMETQISVPHQTASQSIEDRLKHLRDI